MKGSAAFEAEATTYKNEFRRGVEIVARAVAYVGATYAEAFNGNGRTDILSRVFDRNAFIGECKWWTGQQAMGEALDQLIGYTTWQDSRVALIFHVRNQDMTETIATAKTKLAERDEFIEWLEDESVVEVRCRIRWPEDPERVATLAAVFVHLPPQGCR